MRLKGFVFVAMVSFFVLQTAGFAKTTKLVVHVKARDAKFIGTSMGGALVVVKDAETGAILAEGITTGGTGNTTKIMREPWQRGVNLSDASAAKFETTLDLKKPTFVTISATGPLAQRQSAATSSTQIWLIPGKHIEGDGVLLEIPGFAVNIISPQTSEGFKSGAAGATISIRANVVMMCGCPITSGGLWNADQYEVSALVTHDGQITQTVALKISEKANTFAGELLATEKGMYEITVYAYDAQSGNTGVDIVTFHVR